MYDQSVHFLTSFYFGLLRQPLKCEKVRQQNLKLSIGFIQASSYRGFEELRPSIVDPDKVAHYKPRHPDLTLILY